jgi:GDP-D-mannose dehydratase
MEVTNHRGACGPYACVGNVLSHQLPLLPEWPAENNLVAKTRRIAKGSLEKLRTGNIAVARDRGWVPPHLATLLCVVRVPSLDEVEIAIGENQNLCDFLGMLFIAMALDWRGAVSSSLKRNCWDLLCCSGASFRMRRSIAWDSAPVSGDKTGPS